MSLEKKILHIVIKNGASTSKYSFEVDTIIAGRNPDSPLPLIHKDVSRKHVGIYIRGTEVTIEDLGSTNGTFVNGTKLTPYVETAIGSDDDVCIGGLKAVQMKAELEYFNLPKIEEVRAAGEEPAADTVLFEVNPALKPKSSPLKKNDSFEKESPFAGLPKVPSIPNEKSPLTTPKFPQNILKAPENERSLSPVSESIPARSESPIRRSDNEEMYLAQLEEMKQKIILNTNNKAAEIIRAAKLEAEIKAQDVYAQAQRSRKEAEEFYIKRIQEAGRAAEGLQREAQKHSEELFQKTREQCEVMRKHTTETLAVLQSSAQKDCEKMYEDMEHQVRQTKSQRLADFDLSLKQREQDYLAEIAKKNEDRQQDFIDKIEKKRQDHDLALKEELDELHDRINRELNDHIDKIEMESEEHEARIARESAAHEERISRESALHEEKISTELAAHKLRIETESQEHDSKIETELSEHNEKIERQREAHERRIARESEAHEARIKSESAAHEEKVHNETAALMARIESDMEEHHQMIAKEKAEWENTLQRAKEEWNHKLVSLEEEYQEALKKTTAAQEEFTLRSAELASKSSELDKTQTFLKATMTSYEQARKDLLEVQEKKAALTQEFAGEKKEYDLISSTKKRLVEELHELEKHVEREKLALKDKLESDKARFTKEEAEYVSVLRQETLNKMKKVEQELMVNIDRRKATIAKELLLSVEKNSQVVNTQPESWRKEREVLEKDFIQQFDRHLYGMNSESSLPKNIDIKKENRKTAFKQVGMGLALGLGFMFGGQFIYGKLYGPSPMERAVASQQQARQRDLEVRKFNPAKAMEVRDNYVDAVIYTTSFVEAYDSDNFQKEFSSAVAKQMLKLWKVDEDSSLQAVSISRALVRALQEKKEAIHPDYVQNGLTKMRDLEKDSRARITKLLGTNVRYEAFKRMEKEMFENYRAQGTF